jgi:MFS superfamily sulfate permease-like transporter
LAPLFTDLPQATLAAIVIVAVSGFFRVDELRRFARLRVSSLVFALVALAGVLALGVLPGLVVAAGDSLILVIYMLSRPWVGTLARDPDTGVWGRDDRHPDWGGVAGILAARVDGPLFYANSLHVKERLLGLAHRSDLRPRAVVLELAESPDLDVQTIDALGELAEQLASEGIQLHLASVRRPVLELLERAGLADRIHVEPTIDPRYRRRGRRRRAVSPRARTCRGRRVRTCRGRRLRTCSGRRLRTSWR